jgi:3-carboxy-cis,cis-muconate cycloisomerase
MIFVNQVDVNVIEGGDLRVIFSVPARRQRYLDVEAALAAALAELDVIPLAAAEKIAGAARLELLDQERMAVDEARAGHSIVPLISELARVVGDRRRVGRPVR